MKSLINNKHYFLLLTFFVILSSTLFAENEFKETEHKAGAMLQALKEAN